MKNTANQIHDYFRKMKFEQSHTVPKTEEDEGFPEIEDVKTDISEPAKQSEKGCCFLRHLGVRFRLTYKGRDKECVQ